MFIIGEYAAVLILVFGVSTLLFTAYLIFLALQEGCSIVARKLREFTSGTVPLPVRWMAVDPRKS
jgi:hypothetical protein